jgi:hypothetical protein
MIYVYMPFHLGHLVECSRLLTTVMDDEEDGAMGQGALSSSSSSAHECGICYEPVMQKKDARFGLLNCDHCFCLEVGEGIHSGGRCLGPA